MAVEHSRALKALTDLRNAMRKMEVKDPQFKTLLDFHSRRIEHIENDILEHRERNA